MKTQAVRLFVCILFFSISAMAQSNELGFTLGVASPEDARTTAGVGNVKKGFAWQIDYSGRIVNFGAVALYANTPFAVATNTIEAPATTGLASREYRSYYFTPGLKLKVLPRGKVSPYVVGGFGFARIAPRDRPLDDFLDIFDRVNEFSRAYSFGGGVDVKVNRVVAIRGEARRYSTRPFELEDVGIPVPGVDLGFLQERQRNVFVSGGIVLRF